MFRAPNETGKTTIVRALRWALYGDDGLPNKGVGWRMHPIDWDVNESPQVQITVSVEFEISRFISIGAKKIESRQRYRISRSAIERISADGKEWTRTDASVKLFEMSEAGSTPIEPPEAIIRDELPTELRDIFFTDGDKAMDFIEADTTTSSKRARVRKAIRSLLGLGIIKSSISHIENAAREANKRAKKIGGSDQLNSLLQEIEDIEKNILKKRNEEKAKAEELSIAEQHLKDTQDNLDLALEKGDKEKLKHERDALDSRKKILLGDFKALQVEHSKLYEDSELAKLLLSQALEKSKNILGKLEKKGLIPHTTIPVLSHRLEIGECICGESLSTSDSSATHRIDHINQLIESNKSADELKKVMTKLFFKGEDLTASTSIWPNKLKIVIQKRETNYSALEEISKQMKALAAEIDSLPDTNIMEIRKFEKEYSSKCNTLRSQLLDIKHELSTSEQDLVMKKAVRESLLKNQDQGQKVANELAVIQDVLSILENTYTNMTTIELEKVSDMMNKIFLRMIGSDPTQGPLIHSSKITSEFDILVFGPDERMLDPDHDLNGASRRALTLAFILALTNVSEVEAPNIIDTPLGMMDGYVKRSVLKTSIEYSKQIILFLTHSEIADCEDLISEYGGVTKTLTNTAHYPTMLVNNPGVKEKKVLICECDHLHTSNCIICHRRENIETEV